MAIDRGRTPASHFTFPDLLDIADVLRAALADPAVDGAVVVQGTDTIEETAFCWDLVLDGPKPVVVTGAMRASDDAGFDGPANLRDAVRVAASASMRGAGVVVCLAGTIEPADDVIKMHASALDTFAEPERRVARAGDRRRGRALPATGRPAPRRGPTRAAERVHLITATVAMDGVAARRGGRGRRRRDRRRRDRRRQHAIRRCSRPRSARWRPGIPVALASRCPAGRAGAGYAFPGGGAEWIRAGALPVGHLCAVKARVALALGLGAGLDRAGLVALLADPEA